VSAIATTSIAAYRSLDLPELEQTVLDIIESFGKDGCTVSEIEMAHPHIEYQTLSPRFAPLERKGLLYRAGDSRKGASGRLQRVLRHIKYTSVVPVIAPKKVKGNPFYEGMKFAAKVVIMADPSLKGSKAAIALKNELRKVARR
jgi:hypothetical protein